MSTAKNPWTTLSSKSIYSNPWIEVEESQVITPAGKPGIYGKVHFKNTAVGIIPLDEDQNTWIVGQYRYTLKEWSWEIPEGGSPEHESPLESAKRELKEETGIVATQWEEVMKIHTSNSVCDEVGYVFIAKSLTHGTPEFESTEADMKIQKLPFTVVLEMVMNGKITDSLSIAGILKVARMLNIK
jgi:8-oxo-dGTP pyrophosphatase MutT (NUDIX family)